MKRIYLIFSFLLGSFNVYAANAVVAVPFFLLLVLVVPISAIVIGNITTAFVKEAYNRKRNKFIKQNYDNRKLKELSAGEIALMERLIGSLESVKNRSSLGFMIGGVVTFIISCLIFSLIKS